MNLLPITEDSFRKISVEADRITQLSAKPPTHAKNKSENVFGIRDFTEKLLTHRLIKIVEILPLVKKPR